MRNLVLSYVHMEIYCQNTWFSIHKCVKWRYVGGFISLKSKCSLWLNLKSSPSDPLYDVIAWDYGIDIYSHLGYSSTPWIQRRID